jgi:LmbE family N-acetylglucosaminyl deacetylase
VSEHARHTHLFLSPHPDDVALSCGALVAQLYARFERVVMATCYGGAGSLRHLTPYQKEALGFVGHSAALTPAGVMEERASEDRAFAEVVGAELIALGLPDAVFRGYEGEEALLGPPREDDPPPTSALAELLHSVQPDVVYVPLSVGGHIDHRQVFRAGVFELAGGRAGSFSEKDCRAVFYEDFPYAWWDDFRGLDQLRPDQAELLEPAFELKPEYVDVPEPLAHKKLRGIKQYDSQIARLFGTDPEMEAAIRERARIVGEAGGFESAERYWRAERRHAARKPS